MNEPARTPLSQGEIFGVPTWRSSVPEFVEHHDTVMAELKERWDAGKFGHSAFGYGYQTPTELFEDSTIADRPHYGILRDAFLDRCHRILARRHGYAAKVQYEINQVQAWARVQTPEETRFPWHHHLPAVISACYYVAVPEVPEGEGNLMFENPVTDDLFRPSVVHVPPQAGDFILFPSYLLHNPTATPSAKGWRVNINMDAYVSWSR